MTFQISSKINIRQASRFDRVRWASYLDSISEVSFYHDYRWSDVIKKSFGLRAFYLMATEGEKVMGVLPLVFMKSWFFKPCLISLPFLNYGGILADHKEVAEALLSEAQKIQKHLKTAYIEMRYLQKPNLNLVAREYKVTMILDLEKTVDEQWAKLDKKIRNQVRKAEKSDLTTRQGKGELLDAFYKVFCRNMRDLGTPVLGKHFFENILQAFLDESRIYVVYLKDKAIAAAFTLRHHDIVEIPWASSIRDYDKLCPNMLLYWEVIKSAIASGGRQFDFGRCTKDSSTHHFKKQWHAKEHQLYWTYCGNNEADIPIATPEKSSLNIIVSLWQRLPLLVSNRLGPQLAKCIPNF